MGEGFGSETKETEEEEMIAVLIAATERSKTVSSFSFQSNAVK